MISIILISGIMYGWNQIDPTPEVKDLDLEDDVKIEEILNENTPK